MDISAVVVSDAAEVEPLLRAMRQELAALVASDLDITEITARIAAHEYECRACKLDDPAATVAADGSVLEGPELASVRRAAATRRAVLLAASRVRRSERSGLSSGFFAVLFSCVMTSGQLTPLGAVVVPLFMLLLMLFAAKREHTRTVASYPFDVRVASPDNNNNIE